MTPSYVLTGRIADESVVLCAVVAHQCWNTFTVAACTCRGLAAYSCFSLCRVLLLPQKQVHMRFVQIVQVSSIFCPTSYVMING